MSYEVTFLKVNRQLHMHKCYITLVFVFTSIGIKAHPGIGMVYDGYHTIYYTDLNHVWTLDTQTGESDIYLEHIHTHELYLDNSGNLYGEHYWYVESEEKFKNFIWRVNKNGKFEKIRNDQYGENTDFGFVRDEAFASYEIQKAKNTYEISKSDSIVKTILHKIKLNHPTWKYLTKNNELLFVDFPSIYLANTDSITVIAEDISSKRFPFSTQSDDHNIYGIWTDTNETIYVAIYGGREVKKIDSNGNITRILKSGFLWSPVNGVFDNKGNLWVMECKIGGKIRVRKIEQAKLTGKASFFVENGIIASIIVCISLIVIQKIKRNRLKKHN